MYSSINFNRRSDSYSTATAITRLKRLCFLWEPLTSHFSHQASFLNFQQPVICPVISFVFTCHIHWVTWRRSSVMASLPQHSASVSSPRCCRHQQLETLLNRASWVDSHHTLFIHPTEGIWAVGMLVITDRTAINVYAQVFIWTHILFIFKSGIVESYGRVCSMLKQLPCVFRNGPSCLHCHQQSMEFQLLLTFQHLLVSPF